MVESGTEPDACRYRDLGGSLRAGGLKPRSEERDEAERSSTTAPVRAEEWTIYSQPPQ